MAEKAARKAFEYLKKRSEEIVGATYAETQRIINGTVAAVERFEDSVNPLAVPDFRTRLACARGGAENFVEALRTLPTVAQKAAWVAEGCLEAGLIYAE
jgi:hypothetical protein